MMKHWGIWSKAQRMTKLWRMSSRRWGIRLLFNLVIAFCERWVME